MYFNGEISDNYVIVGKKLDNLIQCMKEDKDLMMKHLYCLDFYKNEDLNRYKIKIEPLIKHILR